MKRIAFVIASVFLLHANPASASIALQFDITTFNTTPDGGADHFLENNFTHLDVPTVNGVGHFLAQGTDAHRSEIDAAGNDLAAYYNSLSSLYTSTPNPTNAAAALEAYCTSNFTSSGSEPDWIILNEISGSLWPDTTSKGTTYRAWLTQTIATLHNTYHHDVIIYAPFTTPGANASDWQLLGANSYIGIEDYLSGAEMKAQNFSVSWATAQYNSAKGYYQRLGVPAAQLMLGEEFGNTVAGTGWGRDGVSEADWNTAITARNAAALAANFTGYLSFAWGKNAMGVYEAEQNVYEDTYMATPVLQSEVPEPATLGLAVGGVIWLSRRRRSTTPSV